MTHDARLLWVTLAGVTGLVLLVAAFRLNAFIALALASLGVGLGAGMKPLEVLKAFQEGVGSTLGLIVVVVGLGTMLGRMLAESGGAAVIAEKMVEALGPQRLAWAVLGSAFLVALPVFFAVGLVLLAPVVFGLVRTTGLPLLRLALPLLAGLSVCHTLVPPHPGPVVAVAQLNADMGQTILWGLLIGLPTAALAGPCLAPILSRSIVPRTDLAVGQVSPTSTPPRGRPSCSISLLTILSPVILMLVSTLAIIRGDDAPGRIWVEMIGSPIFAMLIAVLLSLVTFGWLRGFTSSQVLRFTEECVGPAASIFLVVGAGGGFSRVLDTAGVDEVLAAWGRGLTFSPLILGWLIAAALRVAVGSATVAITMASGILAPVASVHPEINRELLVIALGAGTLTLSHLNDGGFWFVKEYFGLTVPQTLRTWTVTVTVASVIALILVLAANSLLSMFRGA